jgi:hypothetical protein
MSLVIKHEYVTWLQKYDWKLFGTLTLRPGIWRKTANRILMSWVAQLQAAESAPLSWARMGEYSPEHHKYHFHILIAGLQPCNVQSAVALWERMAGFAQISPYDPSRRGLDYALKSIEETTDFDFDSQLHDRHLITESHRERLKILPAELVTMDNLSHDCGDWNLQQDAGGTSDRLVPAGRSSGVVKNEANQDSVLPRPRPATTRLLKGRPCVKTMHELWLAMRQRCSSPKLPDYKWHGPKRAIVCWRWIGRNGFNLFVQDVGERPSLLHRLRRINQNAAYSPGNCIWEIPKRPV